LKSMKIKTLVTNHKLLIFVLLLAAILRFWQLGNVPPHLSPDEAALGYNAFSILNTGHDEHHQLFPIIFKSFGDFKPGLYVYLTIPAILLFNLTEFAVRFPSALSGVIAVYLVYKITKRLEFKTSGLEIVASLMLAISPWHIQFSRGAWEANVAITLTLAGIFYFFKSLQKQKYLILSTVFFALTLITYQGAKLSTAIVVLLLVVLYWRDIIKFKLKNITYSLIAGGIISIPVVLSFFSGQTGRLGVFSVFSYPRSDDYLQHFLDETGVNKNSLIYYLFYNEPLNFLRGIMGRYFNHFSGRFLFFEGDWQNPMFSAPYHGMLTLADIPLFVSGVAVAFKNLFKKNNVFIFGWLLLSPLPAVLSRDQVQAVRALNMAVPLSILLAFGTIWIWNKLNFKILKLALIALYLVSYIYYLDAYFVHFPKSRSNDWGYGYKQIVQAIQPYYNDYDRIKIQQSFAQPYIYFLFFDKVSPIEFWLTSDYVDGPAGDVGFVKKFDKYIFSDLHYDVDFNTPGLVAARSSDVPPERISDQNKYSVIERIYNPAGEEEFVVFSVNNVKE